MRQLILEAAQGITEEQKWKKPSNPAGVPVWSHGGIICTGEAYKDKVKLTFMHGAALPDPAGLFNAPGTGGTRRAIDIREGEKVDAAKFKALVRAAVVLNSGSAKKKTKTAASKAEPVKLLSGGNPQIAKGDGDAPVQAYIAAMPGFKRDIGRWLDKLIERHVPNVKKAVRWNSPFYGTEENDWFIAVHCLTKYVKVTFFNGMALKPIPPGGTEKSKEARWIDIYEGDKRDDKLMASWVKQAAKLPGWSGH
ncbi:MAG: DUF1801 domain-containing protein [Flavobacteriales bacterium]|nr:DUF1801 domain-containing protein [Flavobacteriales bacterium]